MLYAKIIFGIFLLSIFSTLPAGEIKREYHETFSVNEGMQIRLISGDGEVTIVPWDKDEVQVDIIYHADHRGGGSDDHAFQVEFDRTEKVLHIVAEEHTGTRYGITSRHIYKYTYDIKAPAYLSLDLEGDDGNITITGWKNNIECALDDGDLDLNDIDCKETYLRLEDGDVKIDKISSDLSIWTDDGDIDIRDLTSDKCVIEVQDGSLNLEKAQGNFRIRFDDGDVNMYKIRGDNLEIRGKDGHIELSLVESKNPDVYLETDDGPIRLHISSDISAELSIETDDGDISTRLSNEQKVKEGRNWYYGILHDGKGAITINTRDGSVRVKEL